MKPGDEAELRRLSELLRGVDAKLSPNAPEREALVKAGLALSQVFTNGDRAPLEDMFASLGEPLSEEQLTELRKLGLKP